MLIKINENVYHLDDSNKIGICFENDDEVDTFKNILNDMPKKIGYRWFVSFPKKLSNQAKSWIKLSKEDKLNFVTLIGERYSIIHNK